MSDVNVKEAVEALLSYMQADMDGVMVQTSRQAIHDVVDTLAQRDARIEELEVALGNIRDRSGIHAKGNPKWIHSIAHSALTTQTT